jgi:hypothetical protein
LVRSSRTGLIYKFNTLGSRHPRIADTSSSNNPRGRCNAVAGRTSGRGRGGAAGERPSRGACRGQGPKPRALVVGVSPLVVMVRKLLIQIPTEEMIAGEEGVVGGEVDLVLVGPRPPLEDFHNIMAVLLRWEERDI